MPRFARASSSLLHFSCRRPLGQGAVHSPRLYSQQIPTTLGSPPTGELPLDAGFLPLSFPLPFPLPRGVAGDWERPPFPPPFPPPLEARYLAHVSSDDRQFAFVCPLRPQA